MVNSREFLKRTKIGQLWPIGAALLLTFSLAPAGHATLVGATPVLPTQTVLVSPLVPGYDAGTLLASETEPYSYMVSGSTNSGTITSAVFMEAGGTLDFYYQVANDSTSSDALERETDVSFAATSPLAVAFSIDPSNLAGVFVTGTEAPVTADLSADGSVVGFNFQPPQDGGVQPGTVSDVLVISTTATTYTQGNASVIDGGTDTVLSYQPGSVPEPMSLFLFGGGLLALGGFSRLRKRAR